MSQHLELMCDVCEFHEKLEVVALPVKVKKQRGSGHLASLWAALQETPPGVWLRVNGRIIGDITNFVAELNRTNYEGQWMTVHGTSTLYLRRLQED